MVASNMKCTRPVKLNVVDAVNLFENECPTEEICLDENNRYRCKPPNVKFSLQCAIAVILIILCIFVLF